MSESDDLCQCVLVNVYPAAYNGGGDGGALDRGWLGGDGVAAPAAAGKKIMYRAAREKDEKMKLCMSLCVRWKDGWKGAK